MTIENKEELLNKVEKLIQAWQTGVLGGQFMPEDANPNYPLGSSENFIYFTLPMALNYQRDSYKLWEAAQKTALDLETADVFKPDLVVKMADDFLREKLSRYKLALQPNRHIQIWKTICYTLSDDFDGDIRNLFSLCHYNVQEIKTYLLSNKKKFPYLSGNKIMNYWLYVMKNYTNANLSGKEYITVAPDRHIIRATLFLGLISEEEAGHHEVQKIVAERWEELFSGTKYNPIDIHTPLWLWSRLDFKEVD